MTTQTTFEDIVNHGLDYLGSNPSADAKRDSIRAATEALRDIANAFNWSYLFTQGRVVTPAPLGAEFRSATIAFDRTGGAYECMVTLAGATWPAWAGDGLLRIGSSVFGVAERKSDTVLTLYPDSAPSDDIAAIGTGFDLFADTFLLPADFASQDESYYRDNFGGMQYSHPRDWFASRHYNYDNPGDPASFTITGHHKYSGRLALRIFPFSRESRTIDFLYKRRPRPLMILKESTGRVSTLDGASLIAGVGTAFHSGMVGSTMRLSANARLPTSDIMGENPAIFESTIVSVVSASNLALADPVPHTLDGAAYTVSDPLDLEYGAMLNAYLRCVEMHLGMSRTLKDKPSAALQYKAALAEAKAADSRSFAGRAVGDGGGTRRRLRDYPSGPDEP